MNDVTDHSIMAALGRQLTIAVAKQSVNASNVANLNTPGYQTRAVSFADVMFRAVQGGPSLAVTNPAHLTGLVDEDAIRHTHAVPGLPMRRDGNNVELDRELLAMTRATGDFTAAQTALTAKFRLIRYAIAEAK
jgi:flagellar basal-body rod protein FlgB